MSWSGAHITTSASREVLRKQLAPMGKASTAGRTKARASAVRFVIGKGQCVCSLDCSLRLAGLSGREMESSRRRCENFPAEKRPSTCYECCNINIVALNHTSSRLDRNEILSYVHVRYRSVPRIGRRADSNSTGIMCCNKDKNKGNEN